MVFRLFREDRDALCEPVSPLRCRQGTGHSSISAGVCDDRDVPRKLVFAQCHCTLSLTEVYAQSAPNSACGRVRHARPRTDIVRCAG